MPTKERYINLFTDYGFKTDSLLPPFFPYSKLPALLRLSEKSPPALSPALHTTCGAGNPRSCMLLRLFFVIHNFKPRKPKQEFPRLYRPIPLPREHH